LKIKTKLSILTELSMFIVNKDEFLDLEPFSDVGYSSYDETVNGTSSYYTTKSNIRFLRKKGRACQK
jgi:hypothetical protein